MSPLGEAPELPQITATVQLAERQTATLNLIRNLCMDRISHGQGHGAAPTKADLIRAEVAEEILSAIEAGA